MEIYFKAKWKWHTVNGGSERRCAGAMNRTTPILRREIEGCAPKEMSRRYQLIRESSRRRRERGIRTLIIKINVSAGNYWNSGVREGRSSGWQTENGREERKKWGNKPGKFIFPRGLPLKFRPSKNGTLNGNPHTMTYNYRAPIDEVELLACARRHRRGTARKYENVW